MKNLCSGPLKLFALLALLCFGVAQRSYSQTAIANPSGTTVTLSPTAASEPRAIGLVGGVTYTYSNSNWPGCITWGLPTTGLNLIRANVLASASCGYDGLTFTTGSGTNLPGGIAAWTGTTNYRASDGATYANRSVTTRLLITVTDGSNNPVEIYSSGGYIFAPIPAGSYTLKVNVKLEATRPSVGVYYGSSTTGACNEGVGAWSPAIHLYNCLATQSTYKICTQFPSTTNSYVFYQGFTNSTTSPAITTTSPTSTNGGSTTSGSMTFNWTGTVGSHPGSLYEYRINGGSWSNTTGTSTVQSLNIGLNTFCVRYYDGCNEAYYPSSGVCYTIYYTPNNVCATIDHGGNDWIISANTTVAGDHINIGTFTVNTGRTATVQAQCAFLVEAVNINILGTGTITGNGSGNVGEGTGGGAGGCYNCSALTGCQSKDNCWDLRTYGGNVGSDGTGTGRGFNGNTGGTGYGRKQKCNNWDDDGGEVGGAGGGGAGGGGSYGGSGGSGGAGGGGGSASRCNGSCGYSYSIGGGGSGGGTNGTYGANSDYNIQMGSGGGASGGGRGKNGGSSGTGAGGDGGGQIMLVAFNNMTITGRIYANGDNGSGSGGTGGSAGETGECCNDLSGGCDERTYTGGGGGNGSGGGGGGAYFNSRATNDGGGGGGGRIKVFYNPCANNTLNPTRNLTGGSVNSAGGTGTYTENVYSVIASGTTVPAQRYVWNGLSSTNWDTGSNWSYFNGTTWSIGVEPPSTANVIVPGPPCTPRNPTISTSNTIKTLEIHADDGAEVTVTCADCPQVTD